MNEHEYLLAWSVYLAAALGLLLVCFRLTAWMWRTLREVLRLAVCVLLFSPTMIEPPKELFSPALAIVALDGFFDMGDNSARALASLKLYAIIALALYLFWVLLRLGWHYLHHSETPSPRQPKPALAPKKPPANARLRRVEPRL